MKKIIKQFIIASCFMLLFGMTAQAEEKAKIIVTASDDNTAAVDLKYAINSDDEKSFSSNNIFEVDKGEGYIVYVKDLAGNITSKIVTVSDTGKVSTTDKPSTNTSNNKNNSSSDKNAGTTVNVTPYDSNKYANNTGSGLMGSGSTIAADSRAGSGTTIRNRIEGEGTLVESEVSGELATPSGKEFYTIQTPDEHIFYLIIDHAQSSDNVYFLDAVSERDLKSLIALGIEEEEPKEEKSNIFTNKEKEEGTEAETESEPEPEKKQNSSMGIIIIIIFVTFAVAYYIKIYKPKQNRYEDALDLEDDFEPIADQDDLQAENQETGTDEPTTDEEGAERDE